MHRLHWRKLQFHPPPKKKVKCCKASASGGGRRKKKLYREINALLTQPMEREKKTHNNGNNPPVFFPSVFPRPPWPALWGEGKGIGGKGEGQTSTPGHHLASWPPPRPPHPHPQPGELATRARASSNRLCAPKSPPPLVIDQHLGEQRRRGPERERNPCYSFTYSVPVWLSLSLFCSMEPGGSFRLNLFLFNMFSCERGRRQILIMINRLTAPARSDSGDFGNSKGIHFI